MYKGIFYRHILSFIVFEILQATKYTILRLHTLKFMVSVNCNVYIELNAKPNIGDRPGFSKMSRKLSETCKLAHLNNSHDVNPQSNMYF